MKRELSLAMLVAFAGLSVPGCGQSNKADPLGGTGNPVVDSLSVWLPIGEQKADLMDSLEHPARYSELLMRFQDSVAKHQEWLMDAIAKAGQGEYLQYHPNTGLTPEEWEEMKLFKDSVRSVPRSTERLTIRDSAGMYRFEGSGRLEFINIFTVDPRRMSVRMADVELPFADTVAVTDNRNAFNSRWHGFSWRYEYPLDFQPEMMKDLSTLTLIQYQFTVGRLQATGQRLISIKAKEIRDGVKTLNLEIPILF